LCYAIDKEEEYVARDADVEYPVKERGLKGFVTVVRREET